MIGGNTQLSPALSPAKTKDHTTTAVQGLVEVATLPSSGGVVSASIVLLVLLPDQVFDPRDQCEQEHGHDGEYDGLISEEKGEGGGIFGRKLGG